VKRGDVDLLSCIRKVCERTKKETTKTEVEKQGLKNLIFPVIKFKCVGYKVQHKCSDNLSCGYAVSTIPHNLYRAFHNV
jgi:hypothetical protein